MHTIGWLLEVDIGIPEGAPRDHVPAYPDREDWSCRGKLLEEGGLGDIRVEVPHVKGGHRVVGTAWTWIHLGSFLLLNSPDSVDRKKRLKLSVGNISTCTH